jgi:hypothetical protein
MPRVSVMNSVGTAPLFGCRDPYSPRVLGEYTSQPYCCSTRDFLNRRAYFTSEAMPISFLRLSCRVVGADTVGFSVRGPTSCTTLACKSARTQSQILVHEETPHNSEARLKGLLALKLVRVLLVTA